MEEGVMEWISGGTASHFSKSGDINRREELKEKLATVEFDGVESQLKWLTMPSPSATKAYALFEEKESGSRWAAAVISRTIGGKQMDYAILPEWTNPPYYECGKRIMQMLTPLDPGKCPESEEWRRRCWEEIDRKKSPFSFESLPGGAQVLWKVSGDDFPFLPRGTQVRLVKEKSGRDWVWRDLASGMFFSKDRVPESDY
ncbi:MAG: hypothetical protein IJC51_05620, partial [Eggerthellaceae bacterium]|nr:hypothetical protein [Eggerthellaceae bacterium]